MRVTLWTAAVIALLAAAPPAFAANPIVGRWLTDDRSAVVRIDRCGRSLCGVIERVLDPRAPARDINSPDRANRSRPLIGTTVLSGFGAAGDEWSGGRAYDPKSGRSYRSTLAVQPDGRPERSPVASSCCAARASGRG